MSQSPSNTTWRGGGVLNTEAAVFSMPTLISCEVQPESISDKCLSDAPSHSNDTTTITLFIETSQGLCSPQMRCESDLTPNALKLIAHPPNPQLKRANLRKLAVSKTRAAAGWPGGCPVLTWTLGRVHQRTCLQRAGGAAPWNY